MEIEKKLCIIGAGGFAKETLSCIDEYFGRNDEKLKNSVCFMVEDNYYESKSVLGIPVLKISDFDVDKYNVSIAISENNVRNRIVDLLPNNTKYAKIIHPKAIISRWVEIGEGCIITACVTIGSDTKIGKHCHFNPNSSIAHDCIIGDYFTIAPSSSISGNCVIGKNVYFGTHSVIKQKLNVCNDVFIGMAAVVTKDIDKKGIYIGIPAKKID